MISLCTIQDIHQVLALERESFPPDEAATEDSLNLRMKEAPQFFYKIKGCRDDEIIGFINGTCINGTSIRHESMSTHIKEGTALVIHSVTVAEKHRRRGIGRKMLLQYIKAIRTTTSVQYILLLSKAYLLSFYTRCGFRVRGLSSVVHGEVIG